MGARGQGAPYHGCCSVALGLTGSEVLARLRYRKAISTNDFRSLRIMECAGRAVIELLI